MINGVRDALTVAALLCVMVWQDPVLTAICFFSVPFIYLTVSKILASIKTAMQQEMKSIADLNRNVREIVQGNKIIKSYTLEPCVEKDSSASIQAIEGISNRIAKLSNAPIPLMDTLGGIGIGLTIFYAGYRTIYHGYDAGTFLSFVTALLMAQDPARRLSQIRVSLKTSLIGIRLVHGILEDREVESDQGSGVVANLYKEPAIEFDNVWFRYGDGGDVLKGFSLKVNTGEMVALVGPSGAGKSTVFSLLMRFYDPHDGAIKVHGSDIRDLSLLSLRQSMAYAGQSNFMFSGTIKDNLSLGFSGIEDERIIAACKETGMHDFICGLSEGYNSPAGELGSMISGGQAQRLNIARAIIKDAPILLLDEITSALDADNEELIKTYMHTQAGKKTILVIAHRLSTIRRADKIALIDNGVVRSFGTHSELMECSDYYSRIAGLQLAA
jgi:ATP-binding cassette subfamily B protein